MKGIIFDLGGVIALTEDLHYEAFHFAFAGFGIDINRNDWNQLYAGKGHRFIIDTIFGESPANDRLINKWVYYYQKIVYRVKPVPGVLDYINKQNCPMIIATGSAKKSAQLILENLKINLPVVSMEDSEKPKPAPDLFLIAAQRIGVDPSDCLVFEDTPYGVEAARRAGMKVIALTTTHDNVFLGDADHIISDFNDMKDPDMNDWQKYLSLKSMNKYRCEVCGGEYYSNIDYPRICTNCY